MEEYKGNWVMWVVSGVLNAPVVVYFLREISRWFKRRNQDDSRLEISKDAELRQVREDYKTEKEKLKDAYDILYRERFEIEKKCWQLEQENISLKEKLKNG